MSRENTVRVQAGDTAKLTWVNTGAAPSTVASTLLDRNHALVSSTAGVSSGDGHYYALHTLPDSGAWYINRWIAVINATTYSRSQFVEAMEMKV